MLLSLFPYFRGAVSMAHRIVTLLCVALFLGIVWLDFGSGINIPALVWHDQPLFQLSAGFSIAALFAYIWLVTYVLDSRFSPAFVRLGARRSREFQARQHKASWRGKAIQYLQWSRLRLMNWILPPGPGPNTHGDGLRWYLSVTFFWCTLLLIPPAFFSVSVDWPFVRFTNPETDRAFIAERWLFVVGVLLAVVAQALAARVVGIVRRKAWAAHRGGSLVHEYWLHTIATALILSLVVLYGAMLIAVKADLLPPPPVMAACALFGLVIGIAGAIWFHLRLWAIPVLGVLLAWIVYCNDAPYKIHFPNLKDEYKAVASLKDFEEPLTAEEVKEQTPAARDAEVVRVTKLVASVQSQRDPQISVGDRVTELSSRGLTKLDRYPDLVKEYQDAVEQLMTDESDALKSWKTHLPRGDKPKLVVITTTGGANRSALWTTTVLSELHKEPELKNLPRHVRVITGASGGMVGAAYYVGSLKEDGSLADGFQANDIAQDFLTPIINGFVFREVPFLPMPFEYTQDRGELLDRAMEGEVPGIKPHVAERLKKVFASTFADLAAGETAGWRPSLIFSPMIVEDGRRLLISNRHVPFLSVNTGDFLLPNRSTFDDVPTDPVPPQKNRPPSSNKRVVVQSSRSKSVNAPRDLPTQDVYSRPAVEFFRLFPQSRNRFRLSTAARMNATFPFLSPAVSLPTNPPRRIVDAGYFDNTGVSLAACWLHEHSEWIAANCSGVVVIQIRDSESHRENRSLAEPEAQSRPFLPGLTGPLSAVNHARTSSASYRNDDLLSKLGETFAQLTRSRNLKQFFTTVVFERDGEVGMNWYLTEADKNKVMGSWTSDKTMNKASLENLKRWWKAH